MKKRIISALMALVIAVTLCFPAFAEETSPAGTDTTAAAETTAADTAEAKTQDSDVYVEASKGWIEPDIHVPAGSDSVKTAGGRFYAEATLPSSYSLVSANLSTSVKNQGSYNTCWTFGAIASAESNLLKRAYAVISSLDLSELQLGYYTYNRSASSQPAGCTGDTVTLGSTYTFDIPGGNDLMTVTSLSRWVGTVNESVAPYTSIGTVLNDGTAAMASNAYVLTDADMISMQDIASVKREILANGAVSTAYGEYSNLTYEKADYYNEDTCAYYNPDVSHFGTNHEVCIVGWDDSFSRSNFSSVDSVNNKTAVQPATDGAWLIKNSWGSYNSLGGYFWLSYADTSTLTEDACSYQMVPAGQAYQNLYQYDGGLELNYYESEGSSAYMSNVFQASASEQLKAVSFWTWDWGVNYEISIYSNVTDDPTSGTLVSSSTTSGTMAYSGYHTVTLNAPALLTAGKKFSVVVKLSAGGSSTKANLICDSSYTAVDSSNRTIFASISSASAGQSFYSENGTDWSDESASGQYNFRIKAFTNDTVKTLQSVSVQTAPGKTAYKTGETFDPSGLVVALSYSDGTTENVVYSSATKDRFTFSPALSQALTASDTAVTITCDGVSTALPISVTVNGPQTVAAPVFTPAAGTYTSSQTVTITCATAGAAIYYTTDGSTPTKYSALYTGPFTLTASATVRAQAFKSGMTQSAAASASYRIVPPAVYNGVDYSAVYDYDYYIAHNPDVYAAFGGDRAATLQHFVLCGMNEGRQGAETFNVTSYRLAYRDLRAAFGTDLAAYYSHYLRCGRAEGRIATGVTAMQGAVTVYNGVDYSAVYDYNYYVQNNRDVFAAYGYNDDAVLSHFVHYGMSEGRQASSTFSVTSYRLAYRDLRAAFGTDLAAYYSHYIRCGRAESRIATGVAAMRGAVTTYGGVDYAGVYDYNYYVQHNPDVFAAYGYNDDAVLAHFVHYGMQEGRQASASFSVSAYQARYADLRAAFGVDLKAYYLHYLNYGKAEGRKAV